jgi:aspartate/methionine/tyrosine aminotransferase
MRRCGVATVPGSSFYVDPRDGGTQLRICFAKQDLDLDRACAGIARLATVRS